MANTYAFGEEAVRQLQEAIQQLQREVHALQEQMVSAQMNNGPAVMHVGVSAGVITGISGSTFGQGYVDVYRPDGTDRGTKIHQQFVVNNAGLIENDRDVMIGRTPFGWMPIVENCP